MGSLIKIALVCALPALLMANGDSEAAQKYFEITGRHTDFVPRAFNFILLAGLLYYLLAEPFKNFLKARTESIATELREIEAARQASKEAQLKSKEELEKAKVRAKEILDDAKAELELIKEQTLAKAEQELALLDKLFEEKCSIEERKMVKETTAKVLDESISGDDIPLDASKIINIVTKEAA